MQKAISRSVRNYLNLIERDGIVAAIIEASCSCWLMPGHLLSDLELAAILQISCDASGAKAVATDLGLNAGRDGAALNGHVHIGLGQVQTRGQLAVPEGREEGRGAVGSAASPEALNHSSRNCSRL